jgi:hypothetical protein
MAETDGIDTTSYHELRHAKVGKDIVATLKRTCEEFRRDFDLMSAWKKTWAAMSLTGGPTVDVLINGLDQVAIAMSSLPAQLFSGNLYVQAKPDFQELVQRSLEAAFRQLCVLGCSRVVGVVVKGHAAAEQIDVQSRFRAAIVCLNKFTTHEHASLTITDFRVPVQTIQAWLVHEDIVARIVRGQTEIQADLRSLMKLKDFAGMESLVGQNDDVEALREVFSKHVEAICVKEIAQSVRDPIQKLNAGYRLAKIVLQNCQSLDFCIRCEGTCLTRPS